MTQAEQRPDDGERRALDRRKKRRRIRALFAGCVAVLATALLGAGLMVGGRVGLEWLRNDTQLLRVRQVDVAPTSWIPPWEIVDIAGVSPGDDFLDVDTDSVATRIQQHPRVARARVEKDWRRRVHLEVIEKPPIALWLGSGPMEVAADGTVLGPPPADDRPTWPIRDPRAWHPRGVDLPLLTGLDLDSLEVGGLLVDRAAREALYFLLLLRHYGRAGEAWLSEVYAREPGDLLAVTLEEGLPLKIGDGRVSRKKVDAIQATLEAVRREGRSVRYVDARFRNQVVVKLDPGKGR